MRNNWLWVINEIEKLRKSLGIPLFDISRLDWDPDFDILDRYTRNIYERLVSRYQKNNVPLHTKVWSSIGTCFLDASKFFYGICCTEICQLKQISCAQDSTTH